MRAVTVIGCRAACASRSGSPRLACLHGMAMPLVDAASATRRWRSSRTRAASAWSTTFVKPLRNQASGDPRSGQDSTGAIVVADKGWRRQGDHDNEVTMIYNVLSDGRR